MTDDEPDDGAEEINIDADAADQDVEELRVLVKLYTRAFGAILACLPGQALLISGAAWDAAGRTHTNLQLKDTEYGVIVRLMSDEEMDYFSAGGKTQ